MSETTNFTRDEIDAQFEKWFEKDESFVMLGIKLGQTKDLLRLCYHSGVLQGLAMAEKRLDAALKRPADR